MQGYKIYKLSLTQVLCHYMYLYVLTVYYRTSQLIIIISTNT